MPTSDNQKLIDHINLYQRSWHVHPFTCGTDSRHENLVPEERDGKVVLACLNCDYVQHWIPSMPPVEFLRAD